MKKISLIITLLITLSYSCSKDELEIDSDNLLIGVWSYSDFQNNATIYNRSMEFTENHCYKFNSDGSLLERKNSGWCGTPPISYADYQGSWKILNDTLIEVVVGYWGGDMSYKLDIESVTASSLKIVYIDGTNQ